MTGPVVVGAEASDRSRDALALGRRLADGLDVEWPGRGEVIESVSSMYG